MPINRRDFISSAAATAALTAAASAPAAEANPAPAQREFYELRRYHLRRGPKQAVFENYLERAWLPAMRRIGIGPVGVFHVMVGPDSPSLHVLIPYASMDEFAGVGEKLRQDEEYREAAAEASGAPADDPTYLRIESSLLRAISGIPKLEVPARTTEGRSRIFELRIYESHSKRANLKKIEMFDIGELAIFRRVGLTPVFFGEALIGSRIPNLTYMLVFDDLAARDEAWRTFGGDPEWRKLRATPGFTDPEIVTHISNLLLRPAGYSQI